MPSSANRPYRGVDFVLGILFLFLGGVLIFWTARFLQPTRTPPSTPGSYHFIVKLDDVAPDTAYAFEMEGRPWLLVRSGPDLAAVSAICTYKGSPIRWDSRNRLLSSEGHECAFSLHGDPVSGLTTSSLEVLKIKVINGRVYGARDLS